MVSVITLVVGVVFYFLESDSGQSHVAAVGAALSVFMVVAMWIFPEAGDRAKRR